MRAASTERSARRSLWADAAYCGLSGIGFIALAGRVARALELPRPLVRAVGVATLGWSAALVCMARASAWRPWLVVVTTANAIAAVGLAAFAITRRNRRVGAGVALAATEVGGFALVQALLLRRSSSSSEDEVQQPPS